MYPRDWRLINSAQLEALPCALVRGRGNATARALAQGDWLIRRKKDGRYLAVVVRGNIRHLLRDGYWNGLASGLNLSPPAPAPLPLTRLREILTALGIDADYGREHQLELVAEPSSLAFAGYDRYRRPLWLRDAAARAWRDMQSAARADDIALEAISGYRSHAYQLNIFARKIARGLSVGEILTVNAAPGYSEHHSGRALDIGTPGDAPAEESFETTLAFAWLLRRAGEFGFRLSYPRDNPHGIVYEPWHWYFVATPPRERS